MIPSCPLATTNQAQCLIQKILSMDLSLVKYSNHIIKVSTLKLPLPVLAGDLAPCV